MMNIHILKILRARLLLPVLLASGCATTSPISQFYMLTPLQQAVSVNPSSTLADKYVIVGPVSFPKYLDRPHIVTRSANAEIYLSDVHRWAEPVQNNFTRVLADNLSRLLGTERIIIAPSRDRTIADYRITMEVIQFDASRTGEVVLAAFWNIYRQDAISPVMTRRSEYKLNASGNASYAEMVDTLSIAVSQISREIAGIINQL
jgi:uncharacterized lipoprotein YmbA